MSDLALWLVIAGMGVITYSIRFSMIGLLHRVAMPPLIVEALRYVPAAVLSAIILPELFHPGAPLIANVVNIRLVAGLAAILAAWRTKNILLTIAVGMAMLWALQALVR